MRRRILSLLLLTALLTALLAGCAQPTPMAPAEARPTGCAE